MCLTILFVRCALDKPFCIQHISCQKLQFMFDPQSTEDRFLSSPQFQELVCPLFLQPLVAVARMSDEGPSEHICKESLKPEKTRFFRLEEDL